MDAKAMWLHLVKEKGEFCSLRHFYRLLPDFYVARKKGRCVCARCKKGQMYLQHFGRVLVDLQGSLEDTVLKNKVKQLRGQLVVVLGLIYRTTTWNRKESTYPFNAKKNYFYYNVRAATTPPHFPDYYTTS